MSTERFKVSARLMVHLGEALISDELVALMELVKNSYDADANYSKVVVDSKFGDGLGRITVEDDGHGMDYDTIKNSFLVLATDFKTKVQKTSPKYKRIALGNKGIGRLSLQRLGSICTVTTKACDGNAFSFTVNWDDYLDPEKEINEISIDVIERPDLNPIFKKGHGTKIEISRIKNTSLWETKGTFLRFKNEILSIINPYSDSEEAFVIYMEINGEHMVSSQYDVEHIRDLADVRASFRFSSNEKRLIIDIVRKRAYIDFLLEGLKKNYSNDTFSISVNQEGIYETFERVRVDLPLAQTFERYPSISSTSSKINYDFLPGDFTGEIFAFDKTTGRRLKEETMFLEAVNGVKLFRNNFRILPYGNPQNDWLNFTKYSQTLKANIYKNHTTSGYVYIDGEENLAKIKEMTNRQGIINDEYGDSFLSICSVVLSGILSLEDIDFRAALQPKKTDVLSIGFGKSRLFCNGLISIAKKKDCIETIKEETLSLKQAVAASPEISPEKAKVMHASIDAIDSRLVVAKTQLDDEERYLKEQHKALDQFLITIGSALISELLAHEIMRTVNGSQGSINRTKEELDKEHPDKAAVVRFLDGVMLHLSYLAKYASVLDVNSYTKRKKKEVVNVKELIYEIIGNLPFLSQDTHDIECAIVGSDIEVEVIKANFTIAIENILINSKYWLDKYDIPNKKIMIDIDSDQRRITIFDNGYGILPNIENQVFDAFVTAKPDNEGRGIGLYITDRLLSEMNMRISLSQERNYKGRRFKFVISF